MVLLMISVLVWIVGGRLIDKHGVLVILHLCNIILLEVTKGLRLLLLLLLMVEHVFVHLLPDGDRGRLLFLLLLLLLLLLVRDCSERMGFLLVFFRDHLCSALLHKHLQLLINC